MKTPRDALIQGLVGHREWLYQNNASFYAAIHTLADMLPFWVDGLSVEASHQDAETHRRKIELMNAPLPKGFQL
jgi:hypothetical protein